jgi:hypothetical protein
MAHNQYCRNVMGSCIRIHQIPEKSMTTSKWICTTFKCRKSTHPCQGYSEDLQQTNEGIPFIASKSNLQKMDQSHLISTRIQSGRVIFERHFLNGITMVKISTAS